MGRHPLEAQAFTLGSRHTASVQGNVHWDDVFAGLAEIGYRGPLVLESFAAVNPDLIGATCMWRTPAHTGPQLASEGIAFLREKAAAAGLQ